MSNLIQQGDQFIESEQPADNGFGQNGYTGPSSDLPGKKTTSGFLPKGDLDNAKAVNVQTRNVSAEQLPAAFGMRDRNANPAKVPANGRPVTRR